MTEFIVSVVVVIVIGSFLELSVIDSSLGSPVLGNLDAPQFSLSGIAINKVFVRQ